MALIDADRQDAARRWARRAFGELSQTASVDHDQVKAAVDAVDDWCEANQASFLAALPLGFKNGSTAAQKALLLAFVVMKRAGVI